jgi:hypothetical protein
MLPAPSFQLLRGLLEAGSWELYVPLAITSAPRGVSVSESS